MIFTEHDFENLIAISRRIRRVYGIIAGSVILIGLVVVVFALLGYFTAINPSITTTISVSGGLVFSMFSALPIRQMIGRYEQEKMLLSLKDKWQISKGPPPQEKQLEKITNMLFDLIKIKIQGA